jgi:nicotinamidase-related amidase
MIGGLRRHAWNVAALMACGTWLATSGAARAASSEPLTLPIRWERPASTPDGFSRQTADRALEPRETALLICDMWDKHWCASATRRCGELAVRMAPLVDAARQRGMKIIHCPSDVVAFYGAHPARQRALSAPKATPPVPIGSWCSLDKAREGELPIDDSDGGCDCQPQCKNYRAWSRQHPAIPVADEDLITDSGQEVYNFLIQEGIKNILYMGVHTNMCVLGRSFGLRQMTRLGFQTLLLRDLTDTMYNPRMRPMVDHAAGTELVVRHIERHWCPTTTSAALAAGLR